MDSIVHEITKSQGHVSEFHFTSLTVFAVIYFVLNQNSVYYFEYFLENSLTIYFLVLNLEIKLHETEQENG